tara:strand:+ start:167 stop:307 length:141 start_codon:yes stop_codon:yes gene_type:complete
MSFLSISRRIVEILMVGATGIEPVTPAVSRQCSTAELRTHLDNFYQ